MVGVSVKHGILPEPMIPIRLELLIVNQRRLPLRSLREERRARECRRSG
jgi:hypothetical protein